MLDKKTKNKIIQWLAFGAHYASGVKIYTQIVGKDHPTVRSFHRFTPSNHQMLIMSLSIRASVPPPKRKETIISDPRVNPQRKLRKDFTFLSEADTPAELKVLMSNKINAYHAFKAAHAKLFDCTTKDEEYSTVRTLVENYIENFHIHQELHYYEKNRKILGKHPVFEEMKRLKAMRNTSTVELYKRKKNIEHNIWRLKKQIATGDKAHLDFDRKKRLESYQVELEEIMKVIHE